MTYLKTLARAVGLGLCVAALSGSALADPGNGNGNGPAATPPGQEKKAETPAAPAPAAVPAPAPAPQAAHGQEQKAENRAKQAEKKAAPKPAATSTSKSTSTAAKASAPGQAKKAEKQAEHKPAKATPPTSKGQSANAHHHVIVCHRTGSLSNPYVVINIPYTAWVNAHSDTTGSHPDLNGNHDIMLKDPASRPGSKDGFDKSDCGAAAAPPAPSVNPTSTQESGVCPTTITATEQVLVGIKHYTGSKSNPFVVISPSEKSAHMNGRHADDEAMYETRTVTRTVSGENCESARPVTQGPATPTGQLTVQPTVQSTVQPAAQPVGGVAGAVSPAAPVAEKAEKAEKAQKPVGGVLGAVASAPEAVAETATSETLPFTGIPLWIAALIGGALLATGLVLRRAG